MSKLIEIGAKICRKWMKMRLQPIRVYCLHHVCAEFDAETMVACDWTQIDEFKKKIIAVRQNGVEFISMTDAQEIMQRDIFRCKKYAVLTFDDGYASLKEILPWLEEQKIPVTLFINGKYLDGKSYRKNPNERYLTKGELLALTTPLVEIGSHGWEHTNAVDMSADVFKQSIAQNIELLHTHQRYIPFHAYTWGRHTKATDAYLQAQGITPVLMDGMKNYNESDVIHRELMN